MKIFRRFRELTSSVDEARNGTFLYQERSVTNYGLGTRRCLL